ncbi:MAG: hypothetical protein ACI9UV_002744 [Algoriphagus sp.]|jgi:hypothetical protein
MTRFSLIILLIIYTQDNHKFEGKWKMYEAEAFLNILSSSNFNLGDDNQKKEIAETFQFALDNTFYSFKGDSVFFTDTGAQKQINYKNGKWLARNDTLIIFESGKFKSHKFFVESLKDDQLIMKIIFPNGEISLSNMKFRKVE